MNYRSIVRLPSRFALLLCLVALAGSCDRPDGDVEAADPAADVPEVPDTAGLADSLAVAGDSEADSAHPFAGFELPAGHPVGREARLARLLLSNASDEPAIVYGDGGAGEVLLDTVPPESERRVDVTTRAFRLGVRSETAAGEALRRDEVTVGADSVLEVSVGRVPAAP